MLYICAFTAVGVVLLGILLFFYFKKRGLHNEKITGGNYFIKQQYISNCEQQYYKIISRLIKDKPNVVFPQVPLSQIVLKADKYQGELNRVIDFCIFSTDFRPLLCIEINDSTHERPERQERDAKVQAILNAAGLPLLTFWPKNGINTQTISDALQQFISI